MEKKRNTDEIAIIEREPFKMPIVDELKKNFIIYANEVNVNRAFAHILSGLKPVAGHALWCMWANGRRANKPYVKSAKVEGEVMSYSPHAGAYSSLARMAADYIYHIPYIDGHGSFGSAIGGPIPAASRYTEMRLSEFIQDVLFYNTKLLNMGLNYLEEDPEPILKDWVALLPLLFITNTSGMGFTISNSWSSGNLFEFRDQLLNYLKTGKVDCSSVYPDFPTGGIIINKSEMKNLYETGKGTIKLRGKTEIVDDTIKIYSLPYQVYPEQFIDDIKKYISNTVNTIIDVRNQCGMNGFLIEIECESNTAEYILDQLFKKTCLQVNIANEFKAVMPSGKVELVTLQSYMESFVNSNIDLVKKEANLNLEEINARLELLHGLLNALEIIDEIIATIKHSKSMDDAKMAIVNMEKYNFTERQADYIVHTPLGRLANLEQVKLQEEKDELENKKKENEELLNSRKVQEKYFLNRFNNLIDKYAWERKTQLDDIIQVADPDSTTQKIKKPEKLKAKKEFMIILTEANCLKKIEISKYRKTSEDEKAIKITQGDKITLVSNKGIMYKINSNKIDKCLPNAAGTQINSIIKLDNERIINIYSKELNLPYIFFITKQGYCKKCEVNSSIGISKSIGATVMKIKAENDELFASKLVKDSNTIEIKTNLDTKQINVADCKASGRNSAGSKLLKLKKNEIIEEVHSL